MPAYQVLELYELSQQGVFIILLSPCTDLTKHLQNLTYNANNQFVMESLDLTKYVI